LHAKDSFILVQAFFRMPNSSSNNALILLNYRALKYEEQGKVNPGLNTNKAANKHTTQRLVYLVAPVMFVVSFWLHVITGTLCLVDPNDSRVVAGSVKIPKDSICLRATRHADYTTVNLISGTPLVRMPVLLRFDSVKLNNETEYSVHLFSHDVVESKSVNCLSNGICTDIFMVSDGERRSLKRVRGTFTYRLHSLESALSTVASRLDSVVGEMHLRTGYDYWLSATHLCYAESLSHSKGGGGGGGSGVLIETNSDGSIYTTVDELAKNEVLLKTPAVRNSLSGPCASQPNVTLFPHASSVESTWLSISNTLKHNSASWDVDSRRTVVETGTACASRLPDLNRDLTLYELDCFWYNTDTCIDYKSVPFRRLASMSLFISLPLSGKGWLSIDEDNTLSSLPMLADSSDAFWYTVLKMVMLTLAASVVFVRSKRKTASSSWLIKHCVQIAFERVGHHITSTTTSITNSSKNVKDSTNKRSTIEDMAVGLVAFLARGIIVSSRYSILVNDGQSRAVSAEFVATAVSAVHWTVRYTMCGLHRDEEEPPVSKLGGSMAIIDSTVAVLVAFSEPPILSSTSLFDPIARMLVSLLISTIVVSRCAFSSSCCGILWPSFMTTKGRLDYAYLLVYSSLAWCIQSIALAIVVADLFVSPAAYSVSRAVEGEHLPIRVTYFLTLLCVGMPRLMATTRHILSAKEHTD
jgi:hypothetical protein